MAETPDVDDAVQRIEELVDRLGEAGTEVRDTAGEVIRLLMSLYGAGFARILEIIGPEAAERLVQDKLISTLLLLHDLHPVPAVTRIEEALRGLERRLHGAKLELLEISNAGVSVRVDLNGAPPAPGNLGAQIERAISDCAPEIGEIEILGLPQPASALVQIAPAAAG